jgi:hypothetical protein
LDDVRNRRLEQLRETESDVYDAVVWLRQNRDMFQKHVFEPVCLEINIKNMKYVDAIENVLSSQLKVGASEFILSYRNVMSIRAVKQPVSMMLTHTICHQII